MTNKIIKLLEESPRTYKELSGPISPCRMSFENRGRVRQIRMAGNRSKKPGRGRFLTVYYLAGDEDRAVDRFVEVNNTMLSEINLSSFSVVDSGLSREMAQKTREEIKKGKPRDGDE